MSNLTVPIMIGLGGFVGALTRFYLSTAVVRAVGQNFTFVATMAVNLAGCFAIGVLIIVATRSSYLSLNMQRCLITGLLGSLTTFSTFALDSLNLLMSGRVVAAMANISINLGLGLLLVWSGIRVAGYYLPDDASL